MFKKIKESAIGFKNTRVLCLSAIFTAMYVVLYFLQIPLTPQSRITFSFLPIALAGWLLGAVPAVCVGAVGDILSFLVHPTGAYFPGFTITSALVGLIFGLCLYKRTQRMLPFVILSKVLVTVFLNILLNSLWISILYEKAFWVYTSGRIVKNLILLPIEIIVLYIVIAFLSHQKVQKNHN